METPEYTDFMRVSISVFCDELYIEKGVEQDEHGSVLYFIGSRGRWRLCSAFDSKALASKILHSITSESGEKGLAAFQDTLLRKLSDVVESVFGSRKTKEKAVERVS